MIERWPLSEVLKRLELTCSLATQTSEYDLRIQEWGQSIRGASTRMRRWFLLRSRRNRESLG